MSTDAGADVYTYTLTYIRFARVPTTRTCVSAPKQMNSRIPSTKIDELILSFRIFVAVETQRIDLLCFDAALIARTLKSLKPKTSAHMIALKEAHIIYAASRATTTRIGTAKTQLDALLMARDSHTDVVAMQAYNKIVTRVTHNLHSAAAETVDETQELVHTAMATQEQLSRDTHVGQQDAIQDDDLEAAFLDYFGDAIATIDTPTPQPIHADITTRMPSNGPSHAPPRLRIIQHT